MTKEPTEEMFTQVREERAPKVYELTDEEVAEIEEAEAEAERGEFAPDEEVRALFDCYRLP